MFLRPRSRARHALLAALLAIGCLAQAVPAAAQARLALVVGNADYASLPALANPRNDAQAVAEALRDLDFEVIALTDASRRELARAVLSFKRRLDRAGGDGVGLFFYAGHGVQAGGENFLIPVDTAIDAEAELEIAAIRTGWVLEQMEAAGSRLNIVILDACRNNPFRSRFRSATRGGLARMRAPRGSLLAYAAGPGEVAEDGQGRHSPYTKALLETLRKPGLKIEEVFKQTRIRVAALTDGRQVPWEESSLTGDFYFKPPGDADTGAVAARRPAETPEAAAGNRELVFWQSVMGSDDPGDYRAYLERFPDGLYAPLARNRLKELRPQDAPRSTGQQTARVAPPLPPPRPEPDARPPEAEGPDGAWRAKVTGRLMTAQFNKTLHCSLELPVIAGRFSRWFTCGGLRWQAKGRVGEDGTLVDAYVWAKYRTAPVPLKGTLIEARAKGGGLSLKLRGERAE